MYRFAEHEIVIPLIVVTELEAKRTHPELGFFAREALRQLDEMRIEHGRLDLPMKVNEEGGELSVDMSQIDASLLPSAFSLDNDGIILATAKLLSTQGADVYVVSKDLPMRVKASALGLSAEEYRAEFVASTGWTGISDVELSESEVNDLYSNGFIDHDSARQLPCHTGLILTSNKGSALGRVTTDKRIKLVRGDIDAFGIHGRSAEQRLALDLLLDDEVGIVSLGGRAGTGKSALAICAGLEHVLERRNHRKVMVFRPLYAVGGQDLGYLPGTEGEKMSPWAQAVFDTLGAIASPEVIQEIVARDLIEVLPLTHIRGRSLHDSFVIVDEAQSLERNVLLTVLSRIGKGSKVVLTHDVAQRDNLRVGRHDGVVAVVEKLKGHPLFAHVTLTRSERSPIAALVTDLLEDFPV
jgi:PhoH-like ATPase